jgi:hypothetical protein
MTILLAAVLLMVAVASYVAANHSLSARAKVLNEPATEVDYGVDDDCNLNKLKLK